MTHRVTTGSRTITILEDVSVDIHSGESVAVVGASGSGKTTLLAMLAGLDVPTSGRVLSDGQDVSGLDEDGRARVRRERVGFVFQSFQLLPALTALENVMLPLELGGEPDARHRAREILDRVGLADRIDHYPRQLSGGEQQRVAIARAFSINPGVLLMDEPFGALDALTKGTMQLEVLKLWNLDNREKTIIMITHDIEEALFLSDRIIVLNNGPASTIKEIVEVHLPRPRNKIEIVKMPEYIELRDKLLHLLTDHFSIEDMGMVYKS